MVSQECSETSSRIAEQRGEGQPTREGGGRGGLTWRRWEQLLEGFRVQDVLSQSGIQHIPYSLQDSSNETLTLLWDIRVPIPAAMEIPHFSCCHTAFQHKHSRRQAESPTSRLERLAQMTNSRQ